jgi:hypothetical protein
MNELDVPLHVVCATEHHVTDRTSRGSPVQVPVQCHGYLMAEAFATNVTVMIENGWPSTSHPSQFPYSSRNSGL